MYRQILVPLDGSELAEQVLPYVNLLGRRLRSSVKLVGVVLPVPATVNVGLNPTFYRDTSSAYEISRSDNYLSRLSGRLQIDGIDATFETLEGNPCTEIVSLAEDDPDTLIAMSTPGRSGVPAS